MNATASYASACRDDVDDVPPGDMFRLKYQPGAPVSNGRLGTWLFLIVEFLFFAILLGSYVMIRFADSTETWPSIVNVQQVRWIGVIKTLLVACSCLTLFLAVRSAGQNSAHRSKLWMAITLALGIGFLGSTAREYYLKYEQGIYPQSSSVLLHDDANLEYLSAVKADCDKQILAIEKSRTAAAGNDQHVEDDAQRLSLLKLIRKGMVQWTQKTVVLAESLETHDLAVASLAHQIYPLNKEPRIDRYLARERSENELLLTELRSSLSVANQEVVDLQLAIEELTAQVRKESSKQPPPEREPSVPASNAQSVTQESALRKRLERVTQQATDASAQSSEIRNRIIPLEARIESLDVCLSADNGMNREYLLKLPMLIPNGNLWARNYFLLTGVHAIHVIGGLLCCMVLMLIPLDVDRASVMASLWRYWLFVGMVWVVMFGLFYLI